MSESPAAGEPISESPATEELISQSTAATETAQALAAIVVDKKAMPVDAAEDLARLLEHSLAVPHLAERRQARLGLLIELISTGDGEYIDTETYERARRQRQNAAGEEWPSASNLSRSFGHWLSAVRAACRFWFDGGKARVFSDHAHILAPYFKYHPREIIDSILKAQVDLKLPLDRWPTEWEYYEWARIKRRLARRSGNECRLPERLTIRKAFGSYEGAVRATQRTVRAAESQRP